MSSLYGSMAEAAANAMQGAMIGRAIGNANDRADHAEHQAELWYNHSKEVEATANAIWHKLQAMKKAKADTEAEVLSLHDELEKVKKIARDFASQQVAMKDLARDNFEYAIRVQLRLGQVEKALHQSSAEKAALATMLEAYTELVEKLGSTNALPPDLQQKVETVYTTFINGDKLVDEPHLQNIIDQAPMPEKTDRILF